METAPLDVIVVGAGAAGVGAAALLRSSGANYVVLEASDLATARARFEEEAPDGVDLILLDQSLPDGEGLAWFEGWRDAPGRPGVVLSSGAHAGELPVDPSEVPRLEFLPKPYHPRDLLGLVALLVQAEAP